jgi:hypothetical protein
LRTEVPGWHDNAVHAIALSLSRREEDSTSTSRATPADGGSRCHFLLVRQVCLIGKKV